MGIEHDDDIISAEAGKEDTEAVEAYQDADAEIPPPKLLPLRPSWSNPRSRWNKNLRYQFNEYMRKQCGIESFLGDEVKDAFDKRLERLRRKINNAQPREGESEEGYSQRREAQKKLTAARARVSGRRNKVCGNDYRCTRCPDICFSSMLCGLKSQVMAEAVGRSARPGNPSKTALKGWGPRE